jgi:hypothetical protein
MRRTTSSTLSQQLFFPIHTFELVIIKSSSMTKVKVEAPTNLEEGYQLTADVDGASVVVVVPEGGVKQGEEFEGTSS